MNSFICKKENISKKKVEQKKNFKIKRDVENANVIKK